MKEVILSKAWKITVDDLKEPWYYDDVTVVAETRGEAKTKGLNEMFHLCAEKLDGTDVCFTDIKARRYKLDDIIEYRGEKMTRSRMSELLWQEGRDSKAKELIDNNPGKLFIVWAGVYNSYWGSNHSGYSSDILFAGKYTGEEAYKIVRGSSKGRDEHVRLLPDDFNYRIDKEINQYKEKIERLESIKI